MKKFCKICTIVGLCLLVAGAAVFGAGFAAGARRFTLPTGLLTVNQDGVSLLRKTVVTLPGYQPEEAALVSHVLQGEAKNLRFDLGNISATVKAGTAFAVEAPEGMEITYRFEGDTFQVTGPDAVDFAIFNFGFSSIGGNNSIVITVPAGEYENIDIDLGTGDALVEAGLSCKNLRVEAGMGTVRLKGLDVTGVCSLKAGMGRIEFAGQGACEISLECGMGEIVAAFSGIQAGDYETALSCGMGSIVLDGQRFSGMGVDTLMNKGAAKKMTLDCGMGQIKVELR